MRRVSGQVFARLLRISRAIAGQMDYQSVLKAIGAELQQLIPHDHLDIVLLTREGSEHICYEIGAHTMWSDLARHPQPTSRSPVRNVLQGKEPFLLSEDGVTDERFHFPGALDDPIFTAKLRSRVIVPMRVQGQVIGSLNISRRERARYCPDDVEVAQYCGDLIAPYCYAIMRAEEARKAAVAEAEARGREDLLRSGALSLTEGMERERRRIAMDLHDQTLADLSRISRKVAQIRSAGPLDAIQVAELEHELAVCLYELRRIIEDTKPGVLEMFGFCDAVEALLLRAARGAQSPPRAHIRDRSHGAVDRLNEIARIGLYRIVQEAINNALRHSDGNAILITLAANASHVRIRIVDNGSGFACPSGSSGGGLDNMRIRAELIGAKLDIMPGPRRGACVSVTVPRHERELARQPFVRAAE